jgi:hypothetical protein
MGKRRVELAINSGAKPRYLLSVIEGSSGDLTLCNLPKGSPNSKRRNRAKDTPADGRSTDNAHGVGFKQLRYSIHTSDRIPDANLIKRTQEFDDGTLKTSVFYTSGIKQTQNFSPIFIQRYDDLRNAIYDIDPESDTINIGSVDPPFGLILSVFVGPPGRQFIFPHKDDFDFAQFRFTKFDLLVMWSFFCALPYGGLEIHMQSTEATGPISPTSDAECIAVFKYWRDLVKAELVQTLSKIPKLKGFKAIAEVNIYFREPRIDTLEYKAFEAAIHTRGIVYAFSGPRRSLT